jgi:DNA (cytosine-5)-methyltransferase 1
MKILNLYAGIGGNRKLWTEHHKDLEITAVENNKEIAKIYKDFFPDDEMIITDAHEYLLHNYQDYDFIWSSPPCPTHSNLRLLSVNRGLIKLKYPDMKLYEEIIILKNFHKGKYCIENVKSYYDPLIQPYISGRHYLWSNFPIHNINTNHLSIKNRNDINVLDRMKDIGIFINNWHGYKGDKHKILKNCVYPELGLHILNQALQRIDKTKSTQLSLLD